jgi:hypothetical protein
MAYGAYARFMDPADEPSYEGVTAENIDIEEIEIAGRFLQVGLLADFIWEDCSGWRVERLFLKVIARTTVNDADGTKRNVTAEDYVPIHDKPEWRGFVDAAAAWANNGLDVSEFAS